jgi:hypothetical protein
MLNFCTLFDSVYLSRGLIMYESLKENCDEFHLYIFAFDTLAYNILDKLQLSCTTVISQEEFENQDLLSIKKSRTRAEYCWTCTSSTIYYVLNNYNVPSCTYLDADLFFYGSPQILINELKGDKTVLITEHRFSKLARFYEQKRAGRFCVQFITFSNTGESREILLKWISQCIDWCYARYEDGKFGDQKYLENWPDEYPNVHILEHQGGGIAPWNVGQYKFICEKNKIMGISPVKNDKFEVIFFHFHFVRILSDGYADLGWNKVRKTVVDQFYLPYIRKILEKEKFLEISSPEYKTSIISVRPQGIRDIAKFLYKRLTKFNLIKFHAILYGLYC